MNEYVGENLLKVDVVSKLSIFLLFPQGLV